MLVNYIYLCHSLFILGSSALRCVAAHLLWAFSLCAQLQHTAIQPLVSKIIASCELYKVQHFLPISVLQVHMMSYMDYRLMNV